jgi:hypothetical protein
MPCVTPAPGSTTPYQALKASTTFFFFTSAAIYLLYRFEHRFSA